MFTDHPLTKRQLGWLILSLGAALVLIGLGVDLVGAGRFNGIGPAQQQLIAAGVLIALFGLTLLPLGDRLA